MSSSISSSSARSDSDLQGEAADWLVRMHDGPLSAQEQRTWLAWRHLSKRHEDAWRRAEDVLGTFRMVPNELAREVVPRLASRKNGASRRRALTALVGVASALPLLWMAGRGSAGLPMLLADHHTAIGEVRTLILPDGTTLVLNTETAIDLRFDSVERRVVLRAGEILIDTAPDTAAVKRPFLVQTEQGYARALGTRYTVRQHDGATAVAVYEGAVELRRKGAADPFALLRQGDAMTFEMSAQSPVTSVQPSALSWQKGMLVARDMPLESLLQELARYRRGLLYSAPEVANLRISGAFPVSNTDQSLALLADTLPVRIVQRTPYWVRVEAR